MLAEKITFVNPRYTKGLRLLGGRRSGNCINYNAEHRQGVVFVRIFIKMRQHVPTYIIIYMYSLYTLLRILTIATVVVPQSARNSDFFKRAIKFVRSVELGSLFIILSRAHTQVRYVYMYYTQVSFLIFVNPSSSDQVCEA